MDFFQTAGKNLLAAEQPAGIQLHVALSEVGTEHLQDSGYFRAKLAQENLIRSGGVSYTLLHATQFMEFLRGIAQSGTIGNAAHLSHAFIQPMAAGDVAPRSLLQRSPRRNMARPRSVARRSFVSTN